MYEFIFLKMLVLITLTCALNYSLCAFLVKAVVNGGPVFSHLSLDPRYFFGSASISDVFDSSW